MNRPARRALFAAAAIAVSIAGGLAAAEPATQRDRQPQICRGAAKQLGSRIRTRARCRTAEQWKAEDEAKAAMPIGAQVTQGQNDGHAAQQPH